MQRRRLVIMGAAGRDFHNFNVVFREDPWTEVVAFTATQIPGIANRRYPAQLAGGLYPQGIPIVPETELDGLIADQHIDLVVFAYSDVSHETVMHAASRVLAAGADFELLGPRSTMLTCRRPVVSICASRTGAGKSQTTRYIAALLAAQAVRPVVIRHPMPYGDLAVQAVQRFADYDDLERHNVTIEEREEYEPHIEAGRIVYAGVDYERIARDAEREADVLLWDGGNNDFAFYKPDLSIVVVDPLRPGHEQHFHPGETNVRLADVVIINKVDTADPDAVEAARASVVALNPRATIVAARSELTLVGEPIEGRRVLVIEDGPTLTHGGMKFGAGVTAARRFGATELVDPRPFAVGSIATVLDTYRDLEPLLPAMGYGPEQQAELAATINAADADVVLCATPIDLGRLLELNKPVTRVRYELAPLVPELLAGRLAPILERAHGRAPVGSVA